MKRRKRRNKPDDARAHMEHFWLRIPFGWLLRKVFFIVRILFCPLRQFITFKNRITSTLMRNWNFSLINLPICVSLEWRRFSLIEPRRKLKTERNEKWKGKGGKLIWISLADLYGLLPRQLSRRSLCGYATGTSRRLAKLPTQVSLLSLDASSILPNSGSCGFYLLSDCRSLQLNQTFPSVDVGRHWIDWAFCTDRRHQSIVLLSNQSQASWCLFANWK